MKTKNEQKKKYRRKQNQNMSNNLKRNAYVMIDHWSQILTVLISLYIYKKWRKRWRSNRNEREEETIMKYL